MSAKEDSDQGDPCWTEECERLARRVSKYAEDSESTKVGTRELEEQLLSPNEFHIFRQREGEVLIASKARWDVQLKGLVELERRCQSFRADVGYLCERQEVLKDLVVSTRAGRWNGRSHFVACLPALQQFSYGGLLLGGYRRRRSTAVGGVQSVEDLNGEHPTGFWQCSSVQTKMKRKFLERTRSRKDFVKT